jgi:hypothetical protein
MFSAFDSPVARIEWQGNSERREESVLAFQLFACDALSCKNQAKRQPHVFSFLLY